MFSRLLPILATFASVGLALTLPVSRDAESEGGLVESVGDVVEVADNILDALVATVVTQLSVPALAALAPFTQFARAAYCDVTGWQCSTYFSPFYHLC